ncbi:MAG: type II toxin-antitoxin system VapC family toxin [Planctomycetota bacterium]|nr:type II toxin-antitoxin system VapC family toxin [Planctomycetota bacterium]
MRSSRVVVDSCVWIGAVVPTEIEHFTCRALIDRVQRGKHRVVIPVPILTEVVCRLSARFRGMGKNPRDAVTVGKGMLELLNVDWLPVDEAFCVGAAELGVRHGLRGMDALIANAALKHRCELITNDRDLLDSSLAEVVRVRRP